MSTATTITLIQQVFATQTKINDLEERITSLACRLFKLSEKLTKSHEKKDLRKILLLTKMKRVLVGQIEGLQERVDEGEDELERLAKAISKEGGFAADWEDDDDVWC